MESNDKDLRDLLEQLNIKAENAEVVMREVRAGDELLQQEPEPQLPEELQLRLEKTIRTRQARIQRLRTFRRIAAVLIVALTLVGLYQWKQGIVQPETGQSVAHAELFEDEVDMWDLAMIQPEELDEEALDLSLTEVLLWWDDVEWENDDSIGKEQNHEDYIT